MTCSNPEPRSASIRTSPLVLEAWRASILGALSLYLDFINLFLFLLRFLGNRRSDY